MHINQIKAKAAGVNLDADVAEGGGYTKDVNTKRSNKICPRCMSKRVNRVLRRCDDCKGTLLYAPEDDIQPFFDRYQAFYIWMKNVWGIEGWFHSDYFVVKANQTKY